MASRALHLSRKLRGLFAGSGSDALNEPEVARAVLALANKRPTETTVLYIGTATYDLEKPRLRQTERSGASRTSIATYTASCVMFVDATDHVLSRRRRRARSR